MQIGAIGPTPPTSLASASAPEFTAKERETRKNVDAAVNTLNQAQIAGPDREYSISIDPQTKQPIVQIVDSSTKEVLDQIPSKYILDVAHSITAQIVSNNAG